MSIYTNDPFEIEFQRITGLAVGRGHAVLKEFLLSDAAVKRFADLLHYASGISFPDIELDCYCRRIATRTGRHDGPISDTWDNSTEKPEYDPDEWGETTPTMCEDIARRMLAAWRMDGTR